MKEFIRKIVAIKNFTGLIYIIFNFIYVGISIYVNKGNNVINAILVVLTLVYLILYVYSVYVEKNKKIKRTSKKVFIKSKKLLGFVNACLIIASVFSNEFNSFITILLAIMTIVFFFVYIIVDFALFIALYKLKKLKIELGWKHDHRD